VRATTGPLASDRTWRAFLVVVLVGSVIARALCILGDRAGGDDLQIYTYFARLVLRGRNPYDAPETGPIDPAYGDNPVGELGFFAGVLALYDSRTALRVVFVSADLAVLTLLAFGYVRTRWWKAQLMVFYAFNPLVLHQWAVNGDDKTVLVAVIVAMLVALERRRFGAAWLAATVLGLLKWLSAYFFVPLVLLTARSLGGMRTVLLAAASVLVVAASMVPYFPDSLTPIARRRERLELEPGHASFTNLLEELGVYHSAMVNVMTAGVILAILVLFVKSRIDMREAVVLSVAAAFLPLPDNGVNRLLFVALPFLLVMRLSNARMAALWIASLVTLVGTVVTTEKFRSAADDVPLGTTLVDLIGPFGSTQFVVLGNVFLISVLALYGFDRLRGRVDEPAIARALRLTHH
jgi:hypothetical protein